MARRSISRVGPVLLAFALAACSGAPITSGQGVSALPQQSVPVTPAGTVEPAPSGLVVDSPLPAPALATADDIAAAAGDPDQAPQVVVSMLQLLGIGLYTSDGTPIRVGTASSDADFYVFEPEVRGLIAMLQSRTAGSEQLRFRDFHAALANLGYTGSADQLASAYQDAYAANPAALVPELVNALGGVDVDGSISSFEEWLLLLDGFIPPNGAATAMADAGPWPGPVASAGGAWGLAFANLRHQSPEALALQSELCARLIAVAASARMTVTTSAPAVHEGHGTFGAPVAISATVRVAGQLTSPFTGAVVLAGSLKGLDITWSGDDALGAHGTLDGSTTEADPGGAARNTFLPKQESANGVGIVKDQRARVGAVVGRGQLLLQLYGATAAPYEPLITGEVAGGASLVVEWHEKPEAAITIVWTDSYDGIDDVMTFLGDLTSAQPGPSGTAYFGEGTVSGSRLGWAKCNPGISVVPSGTVPAVFQGYLAENGQLVIAAFADYASVLTGVSTEAFIVPLQDGTYQGETHLPIGNLCPHGSHGAISISGLQLPSP
ncbi:MAG TPA: hypothetical protein VHL56_08220 [Candidatus Limnocylindrales bacterium]|nr:hypothetical protein [Candidatus Limnocylindrales bacterium]